ncbi:hypothetical protein RZS08_49340, partial [Arthrospira platensis SPKY1]|nr:hypothetical protein [Arthrospira platensis SPKY1]
MENDTAPARLIEVEPTFDGDVEDRLGGEHAQLGRLKLVCGDETLLLAEPRAVRRAVAVVAAVRQKLQCQKRVRRTALAKVQLDRVNRWRFPRAGTNHEIDPEAPQ